MTSLNKEIFTRIYSKKRDNFDLLCKLIMKGRSFQAKHQPINQNSNIIATHPASSSITASSSSSS
jgi:hypothetical protein